MKLKILIKKIDGAIRAIQGFINLVREAIYLAEYGHLPTKTHWENALLQISPQYRTPNMQQLLRKYLKLIEGGGGKPASELEIGFLENLIVSA